MDTSHICPLERKCYENNNNNNLKQSLRLATVFLSFPVSRLKNTFPFALKNLMPWLLEAHLRSSVGTRLCNSRMAFILRIVSKTLGNDVPKGKDFNNNNNNLNDWEF